MSWRPDVVLVTRAEKKDGWGHAVRMLALAEELAGQCSVLAVDAGTRAATTLPWPVPVQMAPGSLPDTTVGVVDVPSEAHATLNHRGEPLCIAFLDHGEAANGADIVVDCQPYAADRNPRSDAATLYGIGWAPLRPAFQRVRHYGVEGHKAGLDNQPDSWDGRVQAEWLASATEAKLPSSVVGLEAICVGVPTAFYPPTPAHDALAEAYTEAQKAGHRPDGMGAKRLAALILAEL